MTERPILFSAPMVRAILAGTKTQTRRLVKEPDSWGCFTGDCSHERQSQCDEYLREFSPYAAGDELWVRERVCIMGETVIYAADWSDAELKESHRMRRRYPELAAAYPDSRWRPSIHMPRKVSRITLRVASVRVERLNEISEADAIAEGMTSDATPILDDQGHAVDYRGLYATDRFIALWDSLNGAGAWVSNPWVWVITFERIKP